MLSLHVGDGSRVWFWKDHWIGDSSSLELFPHLYRLSSLHNASILHFFKIEQTHLSFGTLFFNVLVLFHHSSMPDGRILEI